MGLHSEPMVQSLYRLHCAKMNCQKSATRRKTVAFVTLTRGYGGTEKHLIELIRRLDPTTAEPVILCYGADAYSEQLNGSRRVRVEVQSGLNPPGFLDHWRVLRRNRPDVVTFVNGCLKLFPWWAYLRRDFLWHGASLQSSA